MTRAFQGASEAASFADKPGTKAIESPAGGSSEGSSTAAMRVEGTLKVDFGGLFSTMATLVASVINTAEVSKAMEQGGRPRV